MEGTLSAATLKEEEAISLAFPIFCSHMILLLFCEASKDQLLCLSWILFWFEASSGLRINLDKSELIPVGEVDNVEGLAAELGCQIGSLPSTYLGLPWVPLINLLLCGTILRKECGKDWPPGREVTYPKEGG